MRSFRENSCASKASVCQAHQCQKRRENTHLGARASQIRTEHDNPGGLIVVVAIAGITILQQLEVSTTAVTTLLEFDLVLNDKRLASGVESSLKGSRNSMMRSLGLRHETLVTLDSVNGGLFGVPLANVGERLAAYWSLLGGFRRSPTLGPVIRELFQERRLDARRL